jgi:RHS repeat-associated protein
LNRVTGLAASSSANEVGGYTYQRGLTGNLTNATELNGRTVAWSFDGIYKLTNEQITGDPTAQNNGTVGYTLDPVGNRTADTSALSGVPSGSWNYNADDELSSETYDQDGNVTAAGGKTFSYDSQNELVSMNGGAVEMLYDGDGNRVAKSVTSGGVTTTTYYLVDDLNPTGLPQVMDELTNGVVTRTYTYGLQRISEDQIVSNTWTPSFYNYDGTDSVRQLTNVSGTVTDTYEYDAFGNEISSTGTTPNNYLYRGEQWDPDLGLYYLRARYYNPLSGRFFSVDPLTSEGEPRYEYADADPVDFLDPTGDEAFEEYRAIFAGPSVSLPTIPTYCNGTGSNPMADDLPGCNEDNGGGNGSGTGPGGPPPGHWTVKVDYRPILSLKFGRNCKSIPGCYLPLRFVEHSYVEIDGPSDDPKDKHTWGVLGIRNGNPNLRGSDQEAVYDQQDWDRDPLDGTAGVRSKKVQASDQEAYGFEQALDNRAKPPYPDCPSCGDPYHNGPLGSPWHHLHWQIFSAYNSNTFTYNVIADFLHITLANMPKIGNAPGYHPSQSYSSAGYP